MGLLHTYLNSVEIKKLLVSRSQEFNIPFKWICAEVGINYNHFLERYINALDSSKYVISEKAFEEILELLGVYVKVSLVISKCFRADTVLERLKEKYA
jgi:hypothetical protein